MLLMPRQLRQSRQIVSTVEVGVASVVVVAMVSVTVIVDVAGGYLVIGACAGTEAFPTFKDTGICLR